MRRLLLLNVLALFTTPMLAVAPAVAQSIQTEGDIETAGQLVSTVPSGNAPLIVISSAKVTHLNADLLDGESSTAFVSHEELVAAAALGNPDPPCFDNSHRFVDCGNGTVTDTGTGLIWLENGGCLPSQTWAASNQTAAALYDGATIDPSGGDCGLSDGSRPGDWRLPTRAEWELIADTSCQTTLMDTGIVGNGSPEMGCFNDNPWAEVPAGAFGSYWSSTTRCDSAVCDAHRAVHLSFTGLITDQLKTSGAGVWPVRDWQ